ncbi:MAG: DUF368 domain-containing protein [Lachnospiraceae bacterium]|nr:DUF368 domain-containing protein [Lachnospiraceae bacterium]
MPDYPLLILKGAVVGTGAILPGISGGVLCAAFGVYEPMMELLAHPAKAFPKYYRMFIPFLIGWAAGFVLLARFVETLFSASSQVALMLFAGLILGTIPELLKKSAEGSGRKSPTPMIASLALFFLLFELLSGSGSLSVSPNSLSYVFCGLVWGLSLVIPGLSSSSILIYLGLYEPMTAGIADLDFSVILPLLAGLLLTAALTARLVSFLFEHHYSLVSGAVIGIMLASTLMILPTGFDSLLSGLLSLTLFAAGFAAARGMDIARSRRDGAPCASCSA